MSDITRSLPDAETYYNAMRDLRRGKVTPDDFRAVMRMLRAQVGPTEHNRLKAAAAANLSRV